MTRTTTAAICLILLAILGGAGYEAYLRLELVNARVENLTHRVDRSLDVAEQAATGASVANMYASEAAKNAQTAAGARDEAVQLKAQAESGKAQAETAAQQAREDASRAREQMAQMRKEREEELNHMQEVLSHLVETRRTQNGIVMSLPDNSFKFDFDSAELKPRNRELLSRIAGILLASKGYGLSVFGYTDDVGTLEYNQKLSERRAKMVRDYMVETGIDPGIISVKGYGKTSPTAQGQSESARSKNRRVEIALTDTIIKYGDPMNR